MSETLIPLEAVEQLLHVKRTKIYKMIAADEFPRPVKIGSASRWPNSVVEAWIADRVAEASS